MKLQRLFFCPSCGNREAINLFITNHKGKLIPLLLSSQATIRKSTGEIFCGICKKITSVADIRK